MQGREILVYLAIKNKGEWDAIYLAIQNKEKIDNEEVVKYEIAKLKCKYVTILDVDYPSSLRQAYRPPFVLFYYGDLSLISDYRSCISLVGTRNPSNYGKEITASIAGNLAKDYVIVSGLARGIDAISHKAAIDNGGKTVAILGSGIDNCYPKENLHLYEEIKNNHLLISEYPFNVEPDKEHFPKRNRLIAVLSCATVVTEAKYRSGTSITVGVALNAGRSICAVPHEANKESFCNRLIADGARLVESANDVIDELNYGKNYEVKKS